MKNWKFGNEKFEFPLTQRVVNWRISCAISKAILKLVYRFGIPSSDPRTLRLWCKLSSPIIVAEPRQKFFELFRMQNNQRFPGLCPWTPLGKVYFSLPPRLPSCRTVFPRYTRPKAGTPKKLLDMALNRSHSEVELNCQIKHLRYVASTLMLCSCNIHLATINFQALNLAIQFEIWIGLSVAHTVFGRQH